MAAFGIHPAYRGSLVSVILQSLNPGEGSIPELPVELFLQGILRLKSWLRCTRPSSLASLGLYVLHLLCHSLRELAISSV